MTSQNQNDDIVNNTNEESPLWSYVTKLEKQRTSGGTQTFRCNICGEVRSGSYTRVRAHLLGIKNYGIALCKKRVKSQITEMQRLDDEFEKKKSESGPREVPLPCETLPKKRKSVFSTIDRAFAIGNREHLDQEIARMFYTAGLPFNLARNPHYQKSYHLATSTKIDGYIPPGYNKLRTTLLQKEKDNVERLLIPLKSTWKERGVTIVTDGWSDQDLVYIHNNLRLLSRNCDDYKDERTKMWDVGGDTFDSMEDVGFLEFADLSLDEPELENDLFSNI